MSSTPDDWLTATQASLGICVPDSNTSSAVSPMLAPLLLAVPPRGFAFLEALRLLGARAFQLLPLARDLGQHQLQPVGHRAHAADPSAAVLRTKRLRLRGRSGRVRTRRSALLRRRCWLGFRQHLFKRSLV